MIESHTIMDGKVHVYRRPRSRFWQCAVFLSGRNYRQTTRQENAALAIEFARDWYLDRVAEDRMRRRGLLPALPNVPVTPPPPKRAQPGEITFRQAAKVFVREYEAMTCQSAFKFDPVSASNFDPLERLGLAVALVSSELAGIAETRRARVA